MNPIDRCSDLGDFRYTQVFIVNLENKFLVLLGDKGKQTQESDKRVF